MVLTERARLVDALIAAGRRLDILGLVPARDGNLSARIDDARVLITATAVRKRALLPPDFVEIGPEGGAPAGGAPSTELGLHLAIYRARPDVRAIVHAHPPIALGFACAERGLDVTLLPEAVLQLGSVPLVPYATPGTPGLEEGVVSVLGGSQALLLAHHGALALGASVEEAVDRMEILEHVARATLVAHLLGGAQPLPPGEAARLLALYASR